MKIKDHVNTAFSKNLALSTIGTYMDGQLMAYKKLHVSPAPINCEANKIARKLYVERFSELIRDKL